MDRLRFAPLLALLLLLPVVAYIVGRQTPLVVGLALVNVCLVAASLLWMTRGEDTSRIAG